MVKKEIKLSLDLQGADLVKRGTANVKHKKAERLKILDAKKKSDEFCDQKLRNLEAAAGKEGDRIREDRAKGKEEVEEQAKEKRMSLKRKRTEEVKEEIKEEVKVEVMKAKK